LNILRIFFLNKKDVKLKEIKKRRRKTQTIVLSPIKVVYK